MQDFKTRWWMYVLELENGKYYVGITSKTPQIRMQEHLDGIRGAYWTAKHKPVKLILEEDLGVVYKAHAENYENKVTRDLMKQHGINNVRGGDLTSTEDYIQRFGNIYIREAWTNLMLALALIAILCLFIIYYVINEELFSKIVDLISF